MDKDLPTHFIKMYLHEQKNISLSFLSKMRKKNHIAISTTHRAIQLSYNRKPITLLYPFALFPIFPFSITMMLNTFIGMVRLIDIEDKIHTHTHNIDYDKFFDLDRIASGAAASG